MHPHPIRLVPRIVLSAAALFSVAWSASARQPSLTTGGTTTVEETQFTTAVDVAAKRQWTDSGIDLAAGDNLRLVATGTVQRPAAKPCGPDGLLRGWRELLTRFPVQSGGLGSLVGRVGRGNVTPPFEIGTHHEIKVKSSGRLYLGINEAPNEISEGSFHVIVVITRPAGTFVQTADESPDGNAAIQAPSSEFPSSVLADIPRRVFDNDGNPGDMINLLIVGTDDEVVQAFQKAGWVEVEIVPKTFLLKRIVNDSVVDPITKKMPISQLYLFGRPQDYGFTHAKPEFVFYARHHLRLWKTPYEVGGRPLWAGAATFDLGFMRNVRAWKYTHFIDPNVDDERTFVQETVGGSGAVGQWTLVRPTDPVETARTTTGETYNSNGEILVLWLRKGEGKQQERTSEATCRVPSQGQDSGNSIESCNPSLNGASQAPASAEPVR